MHKKAVIIIAIIVGFLIIASGIAGTIVILNPNRSADESSFDTSLSADPAKQESQTTPDLSMDLGACTVVSYETVRSAFSSVISEVRDANNRGFGHEANGDSSQSCVYAFSADTNLSNRFTMTVTIFKDQANKQNALDDLADFTEVTELGEKAAFFSESDTSILKQNTYTLLVIKDMKQYTLVLAQPSDGDAFTKSSAQTALETIAKKI